MVPIRTCSTARPRPCALKISVDGAFAACRGAMMLVRASASIMRIRRGRLCVPMMGAAITKAPIRRNGQIHTASSAASWVSVISITAAVQWATLGMSAKSRTV